MPHTPARSERCVPVNNSTARPTVAILGASRNRKKFGNLSVRAHHRQGYRVFPINPYAGQIEGLTAYQTLSDLPVQTIDRISVYLPPALGIELLNEMVGLNPGQVWFNPGSTDTALREQARKLGLPVMEGCSIVDVGLTPDEV